MINKLLCKGVRLLKLWIDKLVINFNCPGPPVKEKGIILIWRVTDPRTTQFFEGENLSMNMKNTEKVKLEVKPKNRLGGPATVENAKFTANAPTGAFTIGPDPDDPENPLKAEAVANPQSPGGPDDMGTVFFDCDAAPGEDVVEKHGELAITITPAGAETVEIEAGTPTEQ